MRSRNMWVGCVVVFLVVAFVGAMALAEEKSAAKPAAAAGGEENLFNGKDLAGWQNARTPGGENKWTVEDGTMTNALHGNDIATVATFKDFALKLEYKTVKGGNSGVYLRGRVEIQVLDSYGKEPAGKGDDGAIYDQFAPLVNASKPAGEWNTLEAQYVGDKVTAKLNGKLIQDGVKIEKPTGGALPGGVNEAGPLMLQGDHGKVWYRNITIKPIKAQ